MADKTKIEWTDATVNAINGCSLASPGCTNCYAMKQAHRFPVRQGLTTKTKGGMVWTGEVRFNEKVLEQVLSWKRPRRIFWNAHGDTFHESVPNEWIDRCFDVMAHTPQHIHQVLTKRSGRMRAYFENLPARVRNMDCHAGLDFVDFPLPNVWLGVSVEDQQRADERIPDLLATPAAVRWLSCEPLLGPVDLESAWHGENALDSECCGDCAWCEKGLPPLHNCQRSKGDWTWTRSGLDWIVAGGESGPGARPMHPDWARTLRDQCAAAGVPFFFKQWGEWAPVDDDTPEGTPVTDVMPDGMRVVHGNTLTALLAKAGKKAAGRLLDGVEHNGMPA